jgi:hypothetical protein
LQDFLSKINFREANALFLFFLGLIVLFFITKKNWGKKTAAYLKLIPLYIFLIILQLAIGEYYFANATKLKGKENPIGISAYIFTIFEYSIFAILLSRLIRLTLIKKYLVFSCIIFTIIAVIIWYSIPSFYKAISIATTIESLSIIPFCFYYFFQLLNNPPFLKLTEEPSFWITTGILFLFICITPYYLAVDYFKKIPEMQAIDYFGYDLIVLFLAKASLIKVDRAND